MEMRHLIETRHHAVAEEAHQDLLAGILGRDRHGRVDLDQVGEHAVATADLSLLRALVLDRFGAPRSRDLLIRILETLHDHGRLDIRLVDRAHVIDAYFGHGLVTDPPTPFIAAMRDHLDELTWRLVSSPIPIGRRQVPDRPGPRGLRFVRLAMTWSGDPALADVLGTAELTDAERVTLLELLRDRPIAEQRQVYGWRLRAGDADALAPLGGLTRDAPLVRLIRAMPDGHEAFRQDRAAVLAAVEQAGPAATSLFLQLEPNELVSAALGTNRAAVLKRVKNNALRGIAAFGMLPLAPGETVLDRYLALRESAKSGAKLGPHRKHSHAAAIEVALDHLAQVAGFPDAGRLEWDCEARLVSSTPTSAEIGDYRLALRTDGILTVSRAGKELRSVPAAVRAQPAYQELREHQERLREQARRMRSGLVERLVATGGTLAPEELARLRSLPAGAAMLPDLIWRDRAGAVGLLDEVDSGGPITAVHPVELLDPPTGRRGLGGWQAEIVRRRVKQPVKQAFREVYVLTPAERESIDRSFRFAGHVVAGKVAGQLLSGRGWFLHGESDDYGAVRPVAGGLVAALRCDIRGYFGMADVEFGALSFLRDGRPIPLEEVPPVTFSEVMRDVDLAVSVAGVSSQPYGSPAQAASRAQILAALIDDLSLTRVSIDGGSAVVRGARATYRVHLTSGSIHVEPGGYLCVVPAGFGSTAHRRLFLPFADDDRMTSVILSKVLLLAEDEKITDESILAQLGRLT
ncbi:hypothetical protein GCM10010168_26920 [Actinoplanes ianthinogenes]|uniref:DUF4132 domain-containing protein n=1 Tax=Actinoplanes ianthinogenes TaxID=122358 RepID=A0ABM7LKQ1_9ACTN|nr:DUF4132 domain-containing protein [Actinoplanes ianthinogenes]BCJ39832.1 hypothetical protein Aiant_04890 [Actinoplanes ianthinogenes]GGR08447.1 hypothetical protein GCM10010168_26920 [Actinoplanes ianthinogenes]